jgi:hypothetical protein
MTLQELKDACNKLDRINCSFPIYQQYITQVLLKDISMLPPRFQMLLSDYRVCQEPHTDMNIFRIRSLPFGNYLEEFGYLKYLLITQETGDESMKAKAKMLINNLKNIPE